ncbi:hypothetical protein [Streptomyces sp. GQFP]|uniref:hypothetical protein n=1 Tax=Streptomyces sp. GQFP TaxID=2907545 RepID=UPI001F17539B|nr:hypothetical protein [Streptomyces sp. GQFP]UIX34363.1 hypothetical protein LUX31_32575 [Streptomyces sp. GQFP]
MSFVDHADVFIGSTGDAHTFVVLNRPIRGAERLLTGAGFTARTINGRSIYLLPPTASEEANERAGIAMYGLLSHTHDLVDLSWTTRRSPQDPGPEPDLCFTLSDTALTATAATNEARSLLEQHGFTPSAGSSYQAPVPLNERDLLGAVVRAEYHAYAHGLVVHVDLGIPTPDAIPAAPQRASTAVPGGPATQPTRRRTH